MGGDVMPGADLTPARLEQLLAAATPGPWTQHLVDETLVVSGSHQIATTNIGGTYSQNFQRMAADAELLALSPALAARVIELETMVERPTIQQRAALETPNAK